VSDLDSTQWSELIDSCGLSEEDMVTGAVLLLRTKNMETGASAVCIGQTQDTDPILKLGLLNAAIEIGRHDDWKRVEDGG
jgi:hypothetical protein